MWLRGSHHPAGYELANAAALESHTLLPVTTHPHFMCKGNKVSGSSEWTLVESYFGLLSGLYVCVCVWGAIYISPGKKLLQRLSGAPTVPERGSTGTEAEHLWEIAVPCVVGITKAQPLISLILTPIESSLWQYPSEQVPRGIVLFSGGQSHQVHRNY